VSFAAALVAAALVASPSARAQQLKLEGIAELGTGIEGGGAGYAKGIRRAPTSILAGVAGYIDEQPKTLIVAALFAELEPHTTAGVEARLMRRLTTRFSAYVGGVFVVAPDTLLGPEAGVELSIPFAPRTSLTMGPSVGAFVLGTDLPEGRVLWQACFHVGVELSFDGHASASHEGPSHEAPSHAPHAALSLPRISF
jgi:hypothetical protein